jgi:hypothetical protein
MEKFQSLQKQVLSTWTILEKFWSLKKAGFGHLNFHLMTISLIYYMKLGHGEFNLINKMMTFSVKLTLNPYILWPFNMLCIIFLFTMCYMFCL